MFDAGSIGLSELSLWTKLLAAVEDRDANSGGPEGPPGLLGLAIA